MLLRTTNDTLKSLDFKVQGDNTIERKKSNFGSTQIILFERISRHDSGGLGSQLGELGLELGDVAIEVNSLAGLKLLLPDDDLSKTFDEAVDELNLRETETIGVGNVPDSALGFTVDTGAAAGLELHLLEDLLEVVTAGEEGHLGHGAGAETSTLNTIQKNEIQKR